MSDETISIFLAEELVRTGPGGGDESESIEVHLVPVSEVTEWLGEMMKAGKQVDPKTYAALFWLDRHKAGLPPV
jgi:ADP-ribose pyrophosphatase